MASLIPAQGCPPKWRNEGPVVAVRAVVCTTIVAVTGVVPSRVIVEGTMVHVEPAGAPLHDRNIV